MTNEDFQRRVEFIINRQAQFSSDLGALQDLVTRLAVAGRDRFSDHDPKNAALTDAQLASEERISRVGTSLEKLEAAQTRLTEAQASTDERLSALINLVERFISEKRNGPTRS
jgi:hypothetical protein